MNLYNQVLVETQNKLKEMDGDSKRQFRKVAETFTEVRELLHQRELRVKKILQE
jgi:predicted nucleic acid-binding protein